MLSGLNLSVGRPCGVPDCPDVSLAMFFCTYSLFVAKKGSRTVALGIRAMKVWLLPTTM